VVVVARYTSLSKKILSAPWPSSARSRAKEAAPYLPSGREVPRTYSSGIRGEFRRSEPHQKAPLEFHFCPLDHRSKGASSTEDGHLRRHHGHWLVWGGQHALSPGHMLRPCNANARCGGYVRNRCPNGTTASGPLAPSGATGPTPAHG
jgi:hypothetical protein